MRLTTVLLASSVLFTSPVFAQNNDRLDQLEQEVMLLKRKVDRTAAAAGDTRPVAAAEDGASVGVAQTDVRISALEEELRNLRGKVEEKDFETRRISEEMEKFKRDTEFRLTEIEKNASANAATPALPAAPAAPESSPKQGELGKKAELSVKEAPAESTDDKVAPPTGDTPRDYYNYAFRQLNQNQYEAAAKSFADFTKKFPKDPLVGNAYYWQGETYYIRKDYAHAADNFRLGYEAMPKGPKAADNLLKMAMSLSAMKKKEEACVVFSQVIEKFKTASANTAAKAEAEHKRIGCE